jgi:hemolysin activation/secretion protein
MKARILKTSPFFVAAGLFALGGSVSATAQTYDQLAPKTPAVAAPATLPPASLPARTTSQNAEQLIGPELKGLRFVGDRTAVQPTGVDSTGIVSAGVPLLGTDEFRAVIGPFLGRPLTVALLNEITREVVLYFRRHDRPVVDVMVPEQSVASGTVQVVVIEGRLSRVRVEGSRWFATGLIAGSIRVQPGSEISSGALLEDLAWINQNPFRQADLVFARGDTAGGTDIILRMQDRFPVRLYAGYEDSGNALTGFDRVLAGVNWGNAFGLDHQINYQLTASPDFKKLVAHSGSYVIPVQRLRHTLTLFGSYADSRPELSGGLFALKGRTWQAGLRYRVPLGPLGKWSQDVTAGLDFKRSNNNLSFGGSQVFAQENDIAQAIAAYGVNRSDLGGTTAAEITVAFSPGGLTPGNGDRTFREARSEARANYSYARLELERRTKLPVGFSWLARGTAQLASANLLGSEQLGLGGASNLRGYEEREANGDDGFVLVNELHGPLLHLVKSSDSGRAGDSLDPLVFFDYGMVASHDRLPGEPKRLELASVGAGLRYSLNSYLSVRADYGVQLKDSGVSDGRRDQRGHISVVVSY